MQEWFEVIVVSGGEKKRFRYDKHKEIEARAFFADLKKQNVPCSLHYKASDILDDHVPH